MTLGVFAMNPKWITILRKITRIWSGVIIALGILIFIGEIIESQTMELDPYPWWENLMPAAMFLAVVGLAAGWKWEGIGGAMAVGFALVNVLIYLATGRERVGAVILIMLPVVIPGLLFLVCWRGSRNVSLG
jgi:hypothetical protein